jgi:hypothetical protein
MTPEAIATFLKNEVDPLPDDIYGPRFRCSATLGDGTHLPCVVVQDSEKQVDLAIRRFKETADSPSWRRGRRRSGSGYRDIVRAFAAAGNRLNHYDIENLALSPHALPLHLLRQVEGETSMAWTQFQVEMRDGSTFNFGTAFLMEFFHLPDGYGIDDMLRVIPAPRGASRPAGHIYRERPFFTCFLDNFADIMRGSAT